MYHAINQHVFIKMQISSASGHSSISTPAQKYPPSLLPQATPQNFPKTLTNSSQNPILLAFN